MQFLIRNLFLRVDKMNIDSCMPKTNQCQSFSSSIQNDQEHVVRLLDEVHQWMDNAQISKDKTIDIQIVLAEALNNVIEHGFSHDLTGNIDVRLEQYQKNVTLIIVDNGKPYLPPGAASNPLIAATKTNDLPEGGFGWFLIQEITNSYDYVRRDQKNQLKLQFDYI